MSFEEVKTKWMEIGTTSKENTYIENHYILVKTKELLMAKKE